jgi:Mannitol dehydrogenase Rossmann domain/ATP dependent DNA ligase C terminal region
LEAEAVLNRLAHPDTRIVSLTITEGGYNIDESTKEFVLENPAVQRDLAEPRHPRTAFGFIVEGLLFGKLTPYFTEKCPFTPKPKANAPVKWVEPRFVCEVAFQEWTSDGIMRAPS